MRRVNSDASLAARSEYVAHNLVMCERRDHKGDVALVEGLKQTPRLFNELFVLQEDLG